jgi:hypothetical protein
MRVKPLGCLTPAGILVVLITLLVIGVAVAARGGEMFSPGGLNAREGRALGGVGSHAALVGNCAACHTAPWNPQTMTSLCLDCHTHIAADLRDTTSLHSRLIAEPARVDCRACHTEHHGPLASLTSLPMEDFPHDRTGYSLLAHAQKSDGTVFACGDCHKERLGPMDQAVCLDCHRKIDLAFETNPPAFGANCLNCHDGVDTYGAVFDHAVTRFPLEGKHTGVTCLDCHAGMSSISQLRGTSQNCFTCHEQDDAHAGQLGSDCAVCHSPAGWKPALFDHAQSSFPLTGAHSSIDCADCHGNGQYKNLPTHCAGCHSDPDYHSGLFGSNCADCHNTAGWLPAIFKRTHSFPLNHGRADSCRDCHNSTLSTWTCTTCHDAVEIDKEHREEGISDIANCLRCHADGRKGDGKGGGGKDDD